MDLLQILLHTAQGFALWAVLSRWKTIKHTTERHFLPYLVYVIINDIVARILFYTPYDNYALYNLYDIITFSFLWYWFYTLLKFRVIKFVGVLYLIALAISLIKEDFFHSFSNINVYAGTIMVIIFSMLYFGTLIQKQEVIEFQKTPAFWITTGLLLFNVGYLPIQFLINSNVFEEAPVHLIIIALNILCYGCFAIGFLCHKPIKR